MFGFYWSKVGSTDVDSPQVDDISFISVTPNRFVLKRLPSCELQLLTFCWMTRERWISVSCHVTQHRWCNCSGTHKLSHCNTAWVIHLGLPCNNLSHYSFTKHHRFEPYSGGFGRLVNRGDGAFLGPGQWLLKWQRDKLSSWLTHQPSFCHSSFSLIK